MNKVKYIIGVLISICFLVSCTQKDIITLDENPKNKEEGNVRLYFSTPAILDATVSRADKEEREDYLVKDLYIYVFDATSKELLTKNKEGKTGPAHLEGDELTDGTSGEQLNETSIFGKYNSCWARFTVAKEAFNKDVYIYLIANTMEYKGILEPDKNLESIIRKDELDLLQYTYRYEGNAIRPNRTYILMSGNADQTQGYDDTSVHAVKFHITEAGTIVRADYKTEALITLQRAEAKIKFTFKSGKNGTFTPQTYRIHNYPLKSHIICRYYLQEQFAIDDKMTGKDASLTEKDFIPQTTEIKIDDPNSFTFYMAENLKFPGGANGGNIIGGKDGLESKNNIEGYKLREATNEDKSWKNAPTLATCVEVTGTYKSNNGGKESRVTYFIHPGFSENKTNTYYVNDYLVRRNYEYTYKITVNGIKNIGTKVIQE